MLPIHSLKKDVNCLICHCAVVQQEVNTDCGEQQNVHVYRTTVTWTGRKCMFLLIFFLLVDVLSFLSPYFFSSVVFFFFPIFLSLSFLFLLFPCLLSSFLAHFNSSSVLLQPNVLGKVVDFYSLIVVYSKEFFSTSTSRCFYGLPSFGRG